MRAHDGLSLNPKDASVLVVEDNPDDARIIGRVLQDFGIRQMSLVSTGEDAVAVCSTDPSDVALIDYALPGMNGLRVLERVIEMVPQTKVILLTGLGDIQIAVAAMKLGASDYICKDELFTSGIVNSLQSALRARIAEQTGEMSRLMEQDPDRLHVAESEADWLILYDVEDHGYRKSAPVTIDEAQDDITHVREMLCRYLELTERGFCAPTRKEEEGLVTAFVTRGMSPLAIQSIYRAAVHELRQRRRLDGTTLAVNPMASFARLLSRVIEHYQEQLSMSSLPGRVRQAA